MPYFHSGDLTLHHGDALEVAVTLPTRSVRCIVTSPPYFGLRDYDHPDQIGSEPTLPQYIASLVTVFRELRRVLTDDGTLWLNLGDSYGRDKSLLGMPWRTAFALQDDGWILRSDIIWAKSNPMPESIRDRPTKAHEYLFLLAKSKRYHYNADAVAEPVAESSLKLRAMPGVGGGKYGAEFEVDPLHRTKSNKRFEVRPTRSRRTVWTLGSRPFPDAHFATFPTTLVWPCILAGSEPGDTVLDPFSGSGTTGLVVFEAGRKYIGIDINAEYLDLSLSTRFATALNTLDLE